MNEQADDIKAATAVMNVLVDSTLRPSLHCIKYHFNGISMTRDEIIGTLAAIPKPIYCRAVNENGRIVVSANPIQDTMSYVDWRTTFPITMVPPIGEDNYVLLRTTNDSIRLGKAAFRKLLSDYALTVPPSLTGDWPSPQESSLGIVWELCVAHDDCGEAYSATPEEMQEILDKINEVKRADFPSR